MTRMNDLTGQRFGRLVVIERAENGDRGGARWKCLCDCGNEKTVSRDNLKNGDTKSCGCLQKEMGVISGKSKLINLVGQKFGKLLVKEFIEIDNGNTWWLCICDCGNERIANTNNLRSGEMNSCGCSKKTTLVDLSGKVFGRWTVIGREKNTINNETRWLCECSCENKTIKIVRGGNLRSGESTNCGCKRKEGLYNKNPTKKAFGESTKNSIYKRYEIGAKKRNIVFYLEKTLFYETIQSNCFYCGCKPSQIVKSRNNNGDFIYNGIDRIDSSIGYIPSNIVPCCGECNSMKMGLSLERFFEKVKLIYKKHQLGGVL